MYKDIIDRLLSFPQRGQIKVDFDLKKKVYCLSIPIFSSREMPKGIESYVEARKSFTFKPHTTFFHREGDKIVLIQEVPFDSYPQEVLRKQIELFWQMSRQCHRMLAEIAVEEKYKNALHLDSHFKE